ncbi:class I SAM-dependent methyltransferase [Rhodococcus tibetensis]|uniref:Methyltransferase domain-containing protein n=1 Tax=Rhodococcus tibetensis TaxID=2965064 RepID=A0ABT1QFJ6_9NOCA|nr:class I SAM-dependent methyltransferase [Rhodococcus sp. FXJ9.536]MCQ4121058.1 methyltransferase domain-containing protein [Rhodococcus sp. FXJ9.536]
MEDAGEVTEVKAASSEAAEWDARYSERDRVWSGEPNGALVDEITGARPGRALDIGCGEGADAIWLARQGWAVTALDVSRVALDRAAAHAAGQDTDITWVLSGLLDADLPSGGFDLVSAQYPALRSSADRAAECALVSAVAPGGILLVVHHDMRNADSAREHGFDPDDWVTPGDVAALLDDSWHIDVNEVRARSISGGAGAHHTHDVVLRAHRPPHRSPLIGHGTASGSLGANTGSLRGTATGTTAPASPLFRRANSHDRGRYWDHREARWVNSYDNRPRA